MASAFSNRLSVVEVCAHEPLELLQFSRLCDEDVFGDWVDIARDLQGFTDVFDDGGVNLIDSREVILGVSAVEVVLQRCTILALRLWRTQGLKAKGGYTFSDFVCVAANQFNLWVVRKSRRLKSSHVA